METILLIDDDKEFLDIAETVLLKAGYKVLKACCPRDAFPILMAMQDEIDLVICDLHMPFTTGPQQKDYVYSFETGVKTIRELQSSLPDKPLLGLSAASALDLQRIARFVFPTPLFHKPSSAQELLGLVKLSLFSPVPSEELSGGDTTMQIN